MHFLLIYVLLGISFVVLNFLLGKFFQTEKHEQQIEAFLNALKNIPPKMIGVVVFLAFFIAIMAWPYGLIMNTINAFSEKE